MLLPYRTDAPVYHLPIATICIIAANVLAHLVMRQAGEETWERLILVYGQFSPWQWITSVFLHAGWLHLIGNMIFLWVFGLIIEGKVGHARFVAIYLLIALVSGLIEQTAMLGSEGGSLGASGVIFGLIAIALVWAPENIIESILVLWIIRHVELRVMTFAGIYLVYQFVEALLLGFGMGSAMLHLLGAVCGLPIGILMVKRAWVDCEGWDWFSRHGKWPFSREPAPARSIAPRPIGRQIPALDPAPPLEAVDCESSLEGFTAWRKIISAGITVPTGTSVTLAHRLTTDGHLSEARSVISVVLRLDAHHPVGLLAARILIDLERPVAARERLDALDASRLDAAAISQARELRLRADALTAAGVIEIDD